MGKKVNMSGKYLVFSCAKAIINIKYSAVGLMPYAYHLQNIYLLQIITYSLQLNKPMFQLLLQIS